MGSIALWFMGVRACMRPRISTSHQRRRIHRSPVTSVTLAPTFDIRAYPGPDVSAQDSRGLAIRLKWDELMDSLSRDRANPSRVWNTYVELSSVMGFGQVPFQVQQQVLRKCVPRAEQLRIAAARRMQARNPPRTPHIYELRLQTIISHMRASGQTPELDDYNFILEQFAAVGHQTGARLVFQELTHLGVQPSYRSYGYCLQAIAHRLTLPCPYRFRSNMFHEASRMCYELLDDMWNRRIPLTSVNFDLIHRIYKETSDRESFEKLLKVGYGIDLAYPDRPPLEMQGPQILMGTGKAMQTENFMPLPFSTAALNTLIDMLGRTKQISRMVMAFEVFTTPMPPPPTSNPSGMQSYTDDDEDDPAFYQFYSDTNASPYHPPSAMPNTTSFNLVIRYAAKANHAVFARHYVVQAMERDREVDAELRADLSSKPLEDIPSPNFAVNRGTFLPPFGLANRTRHFAYLRWTYAQTKLAWKQKKDDLAFYTQWRQRHVIASSIESGTVDSPAGDMLPVSSEQESPDRITDPTNTPPSLDPTAVSPVPSVPELPEALQVDLDAPPPPPTVRKPLNLDLHISLLTRDVDEISDLVKRIRDAVERLSTRVKERLGRRIWQGKDIFLMDLNKRVRIGRKEWIERVGFKMPKRKPAGNHISSSSSRSGARDWQNRQQAPHIHPQKRRRNPLPEDTFI